MEAKFNYHFETETSGPEVESTQFQAYTVDRGINSSRTVSFLVEGQTDSFIDLSKTYLQTIFRVVKDNGAQLDPATDPEKIPCPVFPTTDYGSNLWSQVSVSLNNTPLPPGNDYHLTAKVVDMMSASRTHRLFVENALAGGSRIRFNGSKVSMAYPNTFLEVMHQCAESKPISVYTRISSDFLNTCAQLLPNRMSLNITLSKSKDNIVLCRTQEEEGTFKVEILSATLFVKRVRPNKEALGLAEKMLGSGGKLFYQRLQTIALPCAQGARAWNWHNVFQNIVPRRVFMALVSQESYHGSWSRLSSYFEAGYVSTVRFCQDGREILPQPYRVELKQVPGGKLDTVNSDVKSAFLGYCQAIGIFATPSSGIGLDIESFLDGSLVYAVETAHAETHAPAQGSFDAFIDFALPTKEPMMIIIVGEFPKTISFDSDRRLTYL